MKAFVIAAETVTDDALFGAYREKVAATLTAFGGTFIVRGGTITTLEGEWPHARLVVIEFPSRAAAEGWYSSADYQAIIGLRHKGSHGSLVIVDGPA
jgi:uncharacterized protein (DUF1330 family)